MIDFELKKEGYENYSAVYAEKSNLRWHGYSAGWNDCENTYLKKLEEIELENCKLKELNALLREAILR